MDKTTFLPGVEVPYVIDRLAKAGGNEVASGKLDSMDSSAALAVNVFGWFIRRACLLPLFPGMRPGVPAERVEIEYCARFPWSGGRHPWLDAFVETDCEIVGVESKRFEPRLKDADRNRRVSAWRKAVRAVISFYSE